MIIRSGSTKILGLLNYICMLALCMTMNYSTEISSFQSCYCHNERINEEKLVKAGNSLKIIKDTYSDNYFV